MNNKTRSIICFPLKGLNIILIVVKCLYVSLSGWSAKEVNFNKEFHEFETAFMFSGDTQRQGFHTNIKMITSQYKKAIRQGDHGATMLLWTGQIGKTPDNAPLDIQHFHRGSSQHCIKSATPCNNKT